MTEQTTEVVAPVEESMEQYAARRESEMRGEKSAEVIEPVQPAAATEKPAAATEEAKPVDKAGEETDEDEHPEKLIEETHPAKQRINNKVAKLSGARDKALAEAEAARKEAAEAKEQATRLQADLEAARKAAEEKPLPVVPKAEEDLTPNREAFNDPDEFDLARTAWATRQEIRKANEAAEVEVQKRRDAVKAEDETKRQAQVQEQIVALHKTFNERVEKAAPDYPDFAEKVTNNEKLTLRNDVFFTIEQSEMAPHILYHLANNPDDAAALNAMAPIQAAMRLGEIQAEIRQARKPKPSKAAEPIKTIGHRSSPERKAPEEMSMEEYAAFRETEERAKNASQRRTH